MTLLAIEVVEKEFYVHCTDTLPLRAVSSCQPRFILLYSTDVLKYKVVKFGGLDPFAVAVFVLKHDSKR